MYWIVTDSTIDMPESFAGSYKDFRVVNLTYIIDGQSYVPDGTDAHARSVYDKMREGKMITTSQVNSETWKEAFEDILQQGHDILCIAFSSGLSGTYQAATVAAEELREKYPERKLEVIDSLAASAGEGLLVYYTLKNREKGMSLAENTAWIRANVNNVVHWFTVNDLIHLMRGGRVSAVSAYVGTLVKIKPVMHVNEEGKLIPREKVMGRRKSLRALVDKIKEKIVDPEGQLVTISHGDCEDEARWVGEQIKAELPMVDVQISYVGPVIGAHTGPGVVAVFCMGNGKQ